MVIEVPFGYTGGQLRNLRSIKAYAGHGIEVNLVVPYCGTKIIHKDLNSYPLNHGRCLPKCRWFKYNTKNKKCRG